MKGSIHITKWWFLNNNNLKLFENITMKKCKSHLFKNK